MPRRPEDTLRAVAWMDVGLTLPLAVPWVAERWIDLLGALDALLGLGTSPRALDGLGRFFLYLAGIVTVCWNLGRALTADRTLAWIDVRARWLVSALIVWAIADAGVTPVLLAFCATEIGGSFVQHRALRNPR